MAEEKKLDWITPQFDPRFPNPNQTVHCFQSYIDYHKCVNIKGDEFAPCKVFLRTFTSLCPTAWVSKWDEQREQGIFPVKLESAATKEE